MDESKDALPPPYGQIIDRICEVNEALAPAVVDALEDAGELTRPEPLPEEKEETTSGAPPAATT